MAVLTQRNGPQLAGAALARHQILGRIEFAERCPFAGPRLGDLPYLDVAAEADRCGDLAVTRDGEVMTAELMGAREGLDERRRGLVDCMYMYCRGATGGEEGCGGCGEGKDVGYVSFRVLEPRSLESSWGHCCERENGGSIVATLLRAKAW